MLVPEDPVSPRSSSTCEGHQTTADIHRFQNPDAMVNVSHGGVRQSPGVATYRSNADACDWNGMRRELKGWGGRAVRGGTEISVADYVRATPTAGPSRRIGTVW